MNDQLKGEIDRLSAEQRPDRYEPAAGSADWMVAVGDQVAYLILPREAQRQLALDLVKKREIVKLRQSNRLLRDIYRTGQLPLGWFDLLPSPIAVGLERVTLRVITTPDLEKFATEERRRAAREFAARNDAVEGAELLCKWMTAAGARHLADLGLADAHH